MSPCLFATWLLLVAPFAYLVIVLVVAYLRHEGWCGPPL